jgi:hypothetical protein
VILLRENPVALFMPDVQGSALTLRSNFLHSKQNLVHWFVFPASGLSMIYGMICVKSAAPRRVCRDAGDPESPPRRQHARLEATSLFK